MNIVAANQQFTVHEHAVLHSGRLEQLTSKPALKRPAIADTLPIAPKSTSNDSFLGLAVAAQKSQGAALAEQVSGEKSTAPASAESTTSTEQNEDKQRFNALQTVGAVKRILDQLSAGKLLSWIDGTSMEKIQAQVVEQRRSSPPNNIAENGAPTAVKVTEWSYRFQEVAANFSGNLTMADGSSVQWSFDLAMREEYFSSRSFSAEPLQDPLILSLAGNATELKTTGFAFDFYGTGEQSQLPDLGKGQYYLMHDLNHNRRLDSGMELFGPRTGQGFAELAMLDENQNTFIEENDPQWQNLYLWSRQQGMQSLQQAGIKAISAESIATSFGLYDGDALLGRIARSGIFLGEQSPLAPYQIGLVQQVDLNI